jgi:hypothetical protein
MGTTKQMKPQLGETRLAETADDSDAYSPRKMTFAETVILTIKLLAGFGLLGAALWGVSLWTLAK